MKYNACVYKGLDIFVALTLISFILLTCRRKLPRYDPKTRQWGPADIEASKRPGEKGNHSYNHISMPALSETYEQRLVIHKSLSWPSCDPSQQEKVDNDDVYVSVWICILVTSKFWVGTNVTLTEPKFLNYAFSSPIVLGHMLSHYRRRLQIFYGIIDTGRKRRTKKIVHQKYLNIANPTKKKRK